MARDEHLLWVTDGRGLRDGVPGLCGDPLRIHWLYINVYVYVFKLVK
jgi:hypothetical protein